MHVKNDHGHSSLALFILTDKLFQATHVKRLLSSKPRTSSMTFVFKAMHVKKWNLTLELLPVSGQGRASKATKQTRICESLCHNFLHFLLPLTSSQPNSATLKHVQLSSPAASYRVHKRKKQD
ncbi:hypothetical protein DUNSADRAFT_18631 [Dunaliella salina]|uniref:Encoded protein n=1 Tax=Dunaliella salina TaxID=3046 RepID=A0ABQ7FZQ5_DUNSA|nr:hypothetical protein DUNSADRAFT_18631 [Dunaliella salina]|eukprot:KAF5827841.1 hypothetical protein DUNSADRAFT_18631 [Dunaliella salina]